MSLVAIGLNHHTAPVDVRERIAFAPERLPDALQNLRRDLSVSEATIVSTCNRTEIYCGMDSTQTPTLVNWLHHYHQAPHETFSPFLFQHHDQQAVHHLMRVCSGLDSMVLGEPQILGQIKQAYRDAGDAGSVGKHLSLLFQSAFKVAKQVRTDTAIGASPVSVAFAAVSLAKQIFGDLNEHTALLIGAGETIELALQHLQSSGIGKAIIANRTLERAQLLANQYQAQAITLSEIPNVLALADITISSTASTLPILGKGAVEQALKLRKHRPMAMIDIAVPRDIEAQVSDLADVFLYTVDDLTEIIDQGMQARKEAAIKAESIIDHQAVSFMQKLRGLDAGTTIADLRAHATGLQQETLKNAQAMLARGESPEKALQYFAHTFTNKLLHKPSTQLREASETGNNTVVDAARKLFDLKDVGQ
ncbi:glutamyl-tRNA reductase [Chromatiales bacterium (ex Bugula neritina AB1)]|nr:glutamyl-tRNA reductase [Chromatiales bacterium (ex Bugula neritina AB1)]